VSRNLANAAQTVRYTGPVKPNGIEASAMRKISAALPAIII